MLSDNTIEAIFFDGASQRKVVSSTTVSDGNHTFHFEKDGTTMRLYLDKLEVSYTTQDTFDLGTVPATTNKLQIGIRNDTQVALSGHYHWITMYGTAIGTSRISTNHDLGLDMGLVGDNSVTPDTLVLTVPAVPSDPEISLDNFDSNKFTQFQYAQMQQKLLPPGEAFPRRQDTFVFSLLLGFACEFVRVDSSIRNLIANAFPQYMGLFINDWEKDLGLPDGVQSIPTAISERRELVRQRWITIRGFLVLFGASRRFFGNLARMLKIQAFTDIIQAADTTTLTLSAGASASDDNYNEMLLTTTDINGNQVQIIVADYNGTTKVITFDRTLDVSNVPAVGANLDISLLKIFDGTTGIGVAYYSEAEYGNSNYGGGVIVVSWTVQGLTTTSTNLRQVVEGMFKLFAPITNRDHLNISWTL